MAGSVRPGDSLSLARRTLILRNAAMRTGFPRADARDDFDRARRQALRAKLAGWVCGRSSSRNRLLVLGEVIIIPGVSAAIPGGTGSARERAAHRELASQAAVPIDRIVGSVEPSRCFDRHFRPTSELPRTRFERIAADIRSGRGMDPVDLYRCGEDYYVLDGHHRIAVARALGERWVWANITEVRINKRARPGQAPERT
jgi:hypothetical protein